MDVFKRSASHRDNAGGGELSQEGSDKLGYIRQGFSQLKANRWGGE